MTNSSHFDWEKNIISLINNRKKNGFIESMPKNNSIDLILSSEHYDVCTELIEQNR